MIPDNLVKLLRKSKKIVAITGAGISAESGIPTFRGAGGYWRKYQGMSLKVLMQVKNDKYHL